VAAGVSPVAAAYAEAFWPGPLSMLLPKSPRLPDILTAGGEKVCVRRTACPIARELCLAVGNAITSSSANRTGLPPGRSLAELDLPDIAVAIDGGTLPPSLASTVFDPDTGKILRQGVISEADLRAVRLPHNC
jgi:L-threonylcarbamoyladenylate synthase